jgi:trehalose 6-phosphate synthase
VYLHRSIPFTELTALYSIADMCLLTSSRDGMNLVAFEYIACQEQRHGVLALSEFAGASVFMADGTVAFHPANIKEMSQAINKGLTMSRDERTERYKKLERFVNTNTRLVSLTLSRCGLYVLTGAVLNGARRLSWSCQRGIASTCL